MNTRGRYESKVQKIGLSLDAFSTGCLVMFLLLFVPYVSAGDNLVMWFLPLTCIVPFVVMPIVYMIIHRFDTLLFGRYHLCMPLSAFAAAPFFVIAWSASGAGGAKSLLLFFSVLLFISMIMIYRYCAFSVRARLSNIGIVDRFLFYDVFCAVGCVAAVGAFAGFLHYDGSTAHINTAYVMGGVAVLLALIQYLITFYNIPRLGGRRVESIKSVFAAFYSGMDVKLYLSALLFEAAFATCAALLVYFAVTLDVGIYGIIGVAATVIAVFGVFACLCAKLVVHRSMLLSIMNVVYIVLSCGALTLLAAFGKPGGGTLAGLIISAAIVGVGGAAAVRQTKLRLITVKPRVTTGTVFILSELTMLAAAGIAMLVAAIVATVFNATLSVTAFIYGFASAVLLATAALILCVLPSKRVGPETTYAPTVNHTATRAPTDVTHA
ncbi:MAG: hypothetical protein J1F71_03240 [Clostridiales bacterium]|nr:hypothetical protein [Clostridiales bacterium]